MCGATTYNRARLLPCGFVGTTGKRAGLSPVRPLFGKQRPHHALIIYDMDTSQTKLIELLREVHLLAFKEIERLNLRIAELETSVRQSVEQPVINTTMHGPLDIQKESGVAVLNEKQVAAYLNVSVASVRRWRFIRKGPRVLKIGGLVRYRREDLLAWLNHLADSGSGARL